MKRTFSTISSNRETDRNDDTQEVRGRNLHAVENKEFAVLHRNIRNDRSKQTNRMSLKSHIRFFDRFPTDISFHISSFLQFKEKRRLTQVSKSFQNVLDDPKANKTLPLNIETLTFDC